MSALRFCMITTFYPPYHFGGDGVNVQRFARGLVRQGHEVVVIHDVDAYNALHDGPEPPAPEEEDGVEVVRLRSRLGALAPLLTHQLGQPIVHGGKIRQILARGRFDVIHYHNISLVGGPGVLAAGHALKVYTAREHWLVCPSNVLWRHGRELCTGRECTRCVLNHGRPPQLWRYTDYLEQQLDHVDLFIALSEFSREKHREFGFRRPMEVLPNLLADTPAETSAPAGDPPQERPYFLFVGRIERIKGLDDVVPVFHSYPDADLLIAGTGDHAPVIRKLAAGNPRVKFLGQVPPDELARYYHHALALLAPSVCFETFGVILIEAFRRSTPVIARRIGPFPEIVEPSGGGELFSSPDELLAAMRRLQQDAALRRRMGEAGYNAFLQHWSESAVIPRYLDLVRRTAERKGHSRIVAALEAVRTLSAAS
ncbi:MAG TPA: glycosyltransferase family 4 protein [Longimicrobiaceae bacterium]|nr:glycosyltransferase family 4 protein [Longimicrobiaceae bacterium]